MVAFGALLTVSLIVAGCQGGTSASAEPKAEKVVLKQGTEVPLVLLTALQSGRTEEGAEVPLLVSEDIKDATGKVLVRRGTPAQGKVSWSRRSQMLDGFANRPARLHIELQTTVAVDGSAVDLVADMKDPEAAYELTRENTGRKASQEKLQKLAEDSRTEAVLVAMNELFEGGDSALLETEQGREQLEMLSKELKLPGLTRLAQEGEIGKARGLLEKLRTGAGPIASLMSGAEVPLTMVSLLEMTGVTREVQDRLRGLSHGRNIHAPVGTPVTGYVGKDITVSVDAKKGN